MEDRVYSPEDGTDVTPGDISDLPIKEQIEYITSWFQALFEDPQNETPYADKEDRGESPYLYLWGGPYHPEDEIRQAFEGRAAEEAIETVAKNMLQEVGYEWAPTSNHPERRALRAEATEESPRYNPIPTLEEISQRIDNGVSPSFGDPLERQEREALRSEIAQLRKMLAQAVPEHGGMGHNQPPEQLSLTVDLKVQISQAIDQMDAELAKTAPDVGVVFTAARMLKNVLIGAAALVGGGFMAAAGTDLYARFADGTILEKVNLISTSAITWLNGVTLPF